jgi:hypothetical protein
MRGFWVSALWLLGCTIEPLTPQAVPAFTGKVVLLKDRPVASGGVSLTLELTPPDGLTSFPSAEEAPLPGGNEDTSFSSDLRIELEARYAADKVQGGNKAGDFVPYLIAIASIENLDTGARLAVFLPPEVSLERGLHYGRNVALVEAVGVSEAGYKLTLQITPPALVSDDDALDKSAPLSTQLRGRSPLSPGISLAPDLAPFAQGTLFSVAPILARGADVTTLAAAFTLADFVEAADGGAADGAEVPTYSY